MIWKLATEHSTRANQYVAGPSSTRRSAAPNVRMLDYLHTFSLGIICLELLCIIGFTPYVAVCGNTREIGLIREFVVLGPGHCLLQ